MHGAGSPAAQRVLIQKLGQIAEKRGYARDIAGCGGACSKAAPAPAPKAAEPAAEDDDDDFWGDDEEQTEEEKAAAAKKLEEAKAKAMAKLAKKEVAQRSLCALEIKPWEAEQDLEELFKKIKSTFVREGLKWSETMSMDAIIEEITEEAFADEVQSMTMTSMSLL
ncbi:hypothetical protein JL720_13972 [Aureococcus anophagefferens]|nr:hypothetical protein JL720_13972 [Aureococcus anophagefferens]